MKNIIYVKNPDWQTKKITIKNRTVKILPTGKVIPTTTNMLRQAAKI